MLAEVLAALKPIDGGHYLDATFGAGGYTRAILAAADCSVTAFDRDPSAIAGGSALLAEYAPRLTLRHADFGALLDEAESVAPTLDGFVLDLGVSSMQIDEAERGFSFQSDGPLDMRMSSSGISAADVVNRESETLIADILYQLGEERRSRAIASAIVRRRSEQPYTRTGELAETVTRVLGRRPGDPKHPATRTFQALRIYVNDEFGQLARGLAAAERMLKPGGRLVVVTFHSLEDRIVKRFIAERAGKAPGGSRHLPAIDSKRAASFRIVNSKPLIPSEGEVAANSRARSARLRAAERTSAAAFDLDFGALDIPAVARSE
jgi:16S rRNA (cytosine1402-N4)-methyltransferase